MDRAELIHTILKNDPPDYGSDPPWCFFGEFHDGVHPEWVWFCNIALSTEGRAKGKKNLEEASDDELQNLLQLLREANGGRYFVE